jgi:hypothetical protein
VCVCVCVCVCGLGGVWCAMSECGVATDVRVEKHDKIPKTCLEQVLI